jgi:hypothetical protein
MAVCARPAEVEMCTGDRSCPRGPGHRNIHKLSDSGKRVKSQEKTFQQHLFSV